MQLKLKYHNQSQHQPRAVIVRGETPMDWLNAIQVWNIPLSQLECYIIPSTIQNLTPMGLLVIFPNEELAKGIEYHQPYGMVAGQLLLPINAELTPAVTLIEMQKLLLYPRQVFHPTIGLIGFEKANQLDWSSIIEFPNIKSTNWNFAKKGNTPFASLRRISIEQYPDDDVIQAFLKEIDKKDLKDIPGAEGGSGGGSLSDAFGKFGFKFLKGGVDAFQNFRYSLGEDLPNQGDQSSSPDMFDKFQQWINKNLEELERKRKKELDRLSDLFDKDMDEALKYAIPLNSPYMNRGFAPPSSTLGRRSTNFNLGGLGGGRAVDGWNVDSHYFELQKKYREAAKRQTELGNYKKAAYIYAHLLGDFAAAANVLEQGNFFREAAALHKDHLNNKPAAASCLERGGLYLEAIEIYLELEKNEKVGDLYKELEQYDKAVEQYEICVEKATEREDVIEAVRLLKSKLYQPKRAMVTAFQGWLNSKQSESSLHLYFNMIDEHNIDLNQQVQSVFENHTPLEKRDAFLNILTKLSKRKMKQDINETATEIAYQIVSDQATNGQHFSNLYQLRNFIPDDRLLNSDISRFSNNQITNRKKPQERTFQLDKDTKWITAVNYHNQFLVLGIKNNHLHLVRGNWYGNFEYYSWAQQVNEDDDIRLICDYEYSDQIILHRVNGTNDFEEKWLRKNKYFDRGLKIFCPKLMQNPTGIGWKDNGNIMMTNMVGNLMQIYELSKEGNLIYAEELDLQGNTPNFSEIKFSPKGLCFSYFDNLAMANYSNLPNINLFHLGDISVIERSSVANNKFAIGSKSGCSILTFEDDHEYDNTFFLNNKVAFNMKFIGDNLVIINNFEVFVFDALLEIPQLKWKEQVHNRLIKILKVSRRNQFALLDKNGKITVWDIEK